MTDAFTLTINRQCHRCPRMERTEITPEDAVKLAKNQKLPKALVAKFMESKTVEFGFLCDTCTTIIGRYFDAMGKQLIKHSALREKAVLDIEESSE